MVPRGVVRLGDLGHAKPPPEAAADVGGIPAVELEVVEPLHLCSSRALVLVVVMVCVSSLVGWASLVVVLMMMGDCTSSFGLSKRA